MPAVVRRPLPWLVTAALFLGVCLDAAGDLRLVEAAKSQNWTLVHGLLKQRVDVNASQPDGATALHWAVYWDAVDAVDRLIRAGARVNASNELGATPLWIASSEGRAQMAERLLQAGADPNAALSTGETPLMSASRAGSAQAVKLLVAHGAKVNAREQGRGQTALMWAVAEQHADIVQALVEAGAEVDARSNVRRMLVNAGADGLTRLTGDYTDLSEEEAGGFTPLLFAARVGDLPSAKFLVAAGAKVNDAAPTGASALVVAIHSGQSAVAEFLLEKGADPNAAGAGYTALHAAILRGDVPLVKSLIARGADHSAPITKSTPTRRSSQDWALHPSWVGASPIWLAARFSDADLMRILAAAGGDARFARKDGTTVLMAPLAVGPDRRPFFAVALPDPKELERRIAEAAAAAVDLGADVNAANEAGDTALHAAAARKLDSVVQLLADRGAKLEVKNNKGQTPLALASAVPRRRTTDAADPSMNSSTADLLKKLGATE